MAGPVLEGKGVASQPGGEQPGMAQGRGGGGGAGETRRHQVADAQAPARAEAFLDPVREHRVDVAARVPDHDEPRPLRRPG